MILIIVVLKEVSNLYNVLYFDVLLFLTNE